VRNLDLALEVTEGEAGQPVFRGAFAHGPPAGRFLYLGWKREGDHAHPWGWHIKITLSGIGYLSSTVVRPMPNLENLIKQAKLYLRWHRDRYYPVAARIRAVLPSYRHLSDREVLAHSFRLSDAQELIARKAGSRPGRRSAREFKP
jgi:Family of unknown function (DUF5990)